MELDLSGRVAVVTGGGSGIGLAVVKRLLGEGALVAAGDLDVTGLCDLVDPASLVAVETDLGSAEGPKDLVDAARRSFGGVEIVINCVGVAPTREGFLSLTDDDLQRTMDVNFMSMLRICRAALPDMVANGRGAIVSVASDAGRMPDPFFVDYALSKAAMLSLSKTISIEFGPKGIRSNVVTPGPVRTPMWDRPGGFADSLAEMFGVDREAAIERFAKQERKLALGRLGDPDEVAALCVFLASDRAGFTTGSDYGVNGGSITTV